MNRFYLLVISCLLIGVMSSKAQTIIPDQNEKGQWGYVDTDGKKVIDYKYKEAYSFMNGRAKVREGDKWGYIDMKGGEVLKIKYSDMYEWNGDYCKIAEGGSIKDGVLIGAKWGVINKQGEVIVKTEYDEIGAVRDGVAYVKKGDKYGYLDNNYRILIPCKYSAIGSFNEQGFVWVNEGGKFGQKNNPDIIEGGKFGVYKRNGTLIVPVNYQAIGTFAEIAPGANPFMGQILSSPAYLMEIATIEKAGLRLVKTTPNLNPLSLKTTDKDYTAAKEYVSNQMKELNEAFINRYSITDQQLYKECGTFNLLTYNFLNPQQFSTLAMPYNTYIAVTNRTESFKDNGEQILDDYRRKENEKLLHKIGVVDGDGNIVVPADKFDMVYCPNDGFVPVVSEKMKRTQLNYYDIKSGKLLFENWIEADAVTPFEKGNAVIATINKQYLINKEGQKISADYNMIFPMRDGIYVVKKDDKCGVLDSLGKEIVTPSYNLIYPLSEGRMCTQKEELGLYGFLDKRGNFAIPAMYEDACSFNFGFARVQTKSGWGVIDAENNVKVKCQWNQIAEMTEWKPNLVWAQHKTNGLWYCQSTETGTLAFKTGYIVCRNFNQDIDGVAIVTGKNDKVGCISPAGDVLIPFVMSDYDITMKAYSEMVKMKKHAWKEIDAYRFIIYNDQKYNTYELTETIDNNIWGY